MTNQLSTEQLNETQLGQVLIDGGVIAGADANRQVQAVADAQAAEPAAQRQLIGDMLVNAKLCDTADVNAGLDIQKNVRTELAQESSQSDSAEHSAEHSAETATENISKMVQDAYAQYEKTHTDYHPANDGQLEIPAGITDTAKPADNPRMIQQVEHSLSKSVEAATVAQPIEISEKKASKG